MNRAATIERIQLLEEKTRRNKLNEGKRVYKSFYPWQRQFNAATKDHDACMLMAANQVGKSRTGCSIDSTHLQGDYPDDWEGHKFNKPPVCWLLGFSGEKTRDLLQAKLFGRFTDGKFEGGYVPADKIIDHRSMTGTPGAMREVRVKHVNGISVCQFWSYSQGQHALMGDIIDWYHVDEEPKEPQIYPQLLRGVINGDEGKGGRGILTFTPENGKTQMVCQFMGEDLELDENEDEVKLEASGMYLQGATWKQCPHITEEKRIKLLAKFPKYQRKMRSEGVPLMGSGLIYEIDEEDLAIKPFKIPDHWFVINGIDFGWDHPQAHVQLVWDRDADIFYVINAWKGSKKQPYEAWHIVKPWAENVPTAWPADGLQTEKGSAKQQKEYYTEAGFRLLPEHATWEDGGVGVWAGIMELHNLMSTGRLRIVSTLFDVFEELRQYHTKTTIKGKSEIVKVKDDLLDACFHPDTEVLTSDGPKKIIDLVGTEGEVVSIDGSLQRYKHCRLTKRNTELITITFDDGHEVVCTPDHKFLTTNGWTNALHLHDELIIKVDESCAYISTEPSTQNWGATIVRQISFCIERSGSLIRGRSLLSTIYITLIKTQRIITSKILAVSGRLIIFQDIIKKEFTENLFARNVKKVLLLNTLESAGSVVINAEQNIEGYQELITKHEHVSDVRQSSRLTSTLKQNTAAGVVREKTGLKQIKENNTLKILRIESAAKNDVYCMEVENTHAFALRNGVIAHNCRYAYMMRRYAIRIFDMYPENQPARPKRDTGRDKGMGY